MPFRLAVSGLVLLFAVSAVQAQPAEKRTWHLQTTDGQTSLSYGTDNPEDTPITFLCKAGQGAVKIFINETGKGVKAKQAMTAELTAGAVVTKASGKTLVNEEAGTPSFEGAMASPDPLFAAMRPAKSLQMTVGPSRQQVPLKELGDKAEKFEAKCRKR